MRPDGVCHRRVREGQLSSTGDSEDIRGHTREKDIVQHLLKNLLDLTLKRIWFKGICVRSSRGGTLNRWANLIYDLRTLLN